MSRGWMVAVCVASSAALAADSKTRTFALPGGRSATLGADGLGWRTDRSGARGLPMALLQQPVPSGMGETGQLDELAVRGRLAQQRPGRFAPGRVVVSLESATLSSAKSVVD